MKKGTILLILLLIAYTYNTYGQEYPILTKINGVKVVVWTLDQDKTNSILIERFYECDSLHAQLEKDIRTMQMIKLEDEIQYNLILEAYENANSMFDLQSENLLSCDEQRKNDKKIIKTLKRQNLFLKIGGIAVTVLIIIVMI